MPIVYIWMLDSEDDIPRDQAEMSYKVGDTLSDCRAMLDSMKILESYGLVSLLNGFDFWNKGRGRRIPVFMERVNKIDDYDGQVFLIPKLPSVAGNILGSKLPVINSVSIVTLEESWLIPNDISPVGSQIQDQIRDPIDTGLSTGLNSNLNCEVGLDGVVADQFVPSSDGSNDPSLPEENNDLQYLQHLQSTSKSMPIHLLDQWKRCIIGLEHHMSVLSMGDHKWHVKLWDDERDEHQGKLVCDECDSHTSGSSKGVMEKNTINNCFLNYKSKHVKTPKHDSNYLRKRKLPWDTASDRAKARQKTMDEKSIVSLGISIMNRVNVDLNKDDVTFLLAVGDVSVEPIHSWKFRTQCKFCGDLFILCPNQRNLDHNLRQHSSSPRHLASVERSRVPDHPMPLLSGRAGRPSRIDKRDTKQKSISTFFGNVGPSSASQTIRQEGTIVALPIESLLCWGYHWENVKYGLSSRAVKGLLGDQIMGVEWFCEPHIQVIVYCPSSDSNLVIDGTFRHMKCNRGSTLGGGFLDLMCQSCHNIPLQSDFRLRIFREDQAAEKRGNRTTGFGRRLDYLTRDEIRCQARVYTSKIKVARKEIQRKDLMICMLKAKFPNLREIVGDAANSGDIFKFCNAIVSAHKCGVFGGKEGVWGLLKDIVFNLNRSKSGRCYSKGTKTIMQALFQHGGRRVIDCLSSNMLGPSINTLQRDRRGFVPFRIGLQEQQFELVGKVYSLAKAKLGIIGDIPCALAEDETSVKSSVRWLSQWDILIGFCGPKVDHDCNAGLEITVGDDRAGFDVICSAFADNVIGHKARVIVANPLISSLPRMCVLASSTCGRFKSPFVQDQWSELEYLWNKHCRELVGPLIGYASDGDAQQQRLMLDDYSGEGNTLQCQNLEWDGWMMSHSFLPNGDPYGMHDQD